MSNNTRFDVYAPEIQRSLKLFVVLSRASRSLMDLAQLDIKRYGLNPSEFAVLELLFHKGPTPIQQIGSRILLASGTMTYVIDKLAAKGLIVRQSCESDRRVIYVQLTPDGETLMERIFPEHAQVLHDAIGTLSTEEQEKLVELLKKVGKGSVSPS
ncbi:MarR family transcriptional regulator [Paenibacillus sp. ACRRX]|uniref:MarR family winged helix-turn-helix transcriptional regulator n=1 Tax=unclassified Paenibacillus TaxID=185978 RepID=UPI001EF45F08|nr:MULTISPECIES: MarR family transcriptional regulator [unclassified Paenibacillus]MCG7408654.1 MarR family transcriptional regulator [Paenibacillus sp. ACRRX]MDK8183417.1 MarR family transcriptional regulator [Paenibacillus sp. UMB4589-SE434]